MSEAVQAENISRETIASAVSIPLNEKAEIDPADKSSISREADSSSIKEYILDVVSEVLGIRWRCLTL